MPTAWICSSAAAQQYSTVICWGEATLLCASCRHSSFHLSHYPQERLGTKWEEITGRTEWFLPLTLNCADAICRSGQWQVGERGSSSAADWAGRRRRPLWRTLEARLEGEDYRLGQVGEVVLIVIVIVTLAPKLISVQECDGALAHRKCSDMLSVLWSRDFFLCICCWGERSNIHQLPIFRTSGSCINGQYIKHGCPALVSKACTWVFLRLTGWCFETGLDGRGLISWRVIGW